MRKADPNDLAGAFRYAMVKVGLRASNWPTEEEEALLFEHVLMEYGNHTADEIKLAFDMAITGRLNIDHKNVVCYENFSCLYFSGIMNAYREWAAPVYKQIMNQQSATEYERKYSKQELDEGYCEAIWKLLEKKLLPPLKLYLHLPNRKTSHDVETQRPVTY